MALKPTRTRQTSARTPCVLLQEKARKNKWFTTTWKSFAKPQNPTNYAGRGDPAAEFQVSLYVPWEFYAKRLFLKRFVQIVLKFAPEVLDCSAGQLRLLVPR